MKRASLLRAFAVACGVFACVGIAGAKDFPSKPIKVIVPWTPGGVTDVSARIVAKKMAEDLKQSVIVENKPGAGGFIGTEYVAKARPDGYTLLVVTKTTHAIAPAMYEKLPYDPVKDFAAISQVTSAPTIVVTSPKSPFNSLADLVAAAKGHPGKLNYANYGPGSSANLATLLFMQTAGIKMTPISYKGATPAKTAIMAGEVAVFFDSMPSSLPMVKAGQLKALAVTGEKRSAAAPNVPTANKSYPGVVFMVWEGFEAPAGTPKPIIDKLHSVIVKVIADPDVRAKLNQLGAAPVSSPTPEVFAKYIAQERDKWTSVVKRAGIPLLKY